MTPLARMSLVLLALAAPQGVALAQDNYPNRPIRFIASQGAGGLSDTWMRAVGDELGTLLGGSVVIEGRPGAAGNIGARACAEAPPDGYTFCILPGETITINPHVMKDTGLDPKKSLVPVMKAFVLTQVFAVNADLGVKNVRRARRAGQGQAQDPELYGALDLQGRLHGGVQQEARRRFRARAIQGRRRRGQQP